MTKLKWNSSIWYYIALSLVVIIVAILGPGGAFAELDFHVVSWAAPALLIGAGVSMYVTHKKQLPVLPPLRTMLWLTAYSLLLVYAFNPGVYSNQFTVHISLLMTMGAVSLMWALLRRWSYCFWCIFLLWELIQSAAFMQYGTRINSLVLAESLEASWEEALAYLTILNLVLFCVAVGLVLLLCRLMRMVLQNAHKSALLNLGLLFSGLSLLFCMPIKQDDFEHEFYWPVGEVPAIWLNVSEALNHNVRTVKYVEELSSPSEQATSISTLKGDEGVVLLVHVGESVRADRMSLNGYERDTTPWLRQQQHLINFPRCVSAACDTCQAQIAILTDARRDIYATDNDMVAHTGSVLDLFQANNFDVYSFFGIPYNRKLKFDRVVRLLTRCSKERFNSVEGPWGSVPQIAEVVRNNPKKNIVVFINNEGSHTPFKYYDHENPPFTPASSDFQNPSANAEAINNAYDNTIHYTDEFFRRVAAELKNRPFLYLYVSDHGEYLGHDGIWGRGALGDSGMSYLETSGCYVGMFMLYSPEFEQLHPHFCKALQAIRANASQVVAHENVFHTLLGVFGIQTPHYNPFLDLTSDHLKPYTGPHPGVKDEAPVSISQRVFQHLLLNNLRRLMTK